MIEDAREQVADLVGSRAADVVFTSGATEANCTVLAVLGHDLYGRHRARVGVGARTRVGATIVDLPVSSQGWPIWALGEPELSRVGPERKRF